MSMIIKSGFKSLSLALLIFFTASLVGAAEAADDDLSDRARAANSQSVTENKTSGAVQSPEAASVNWSVLASGGGPSNLGSYQLRSTLGQTTVGAVALGTGYLNSGYWQDFSSAPCCEGHVGDANHDGGDEPTIGDIAMLIDVLYISLDWTQIWCLSEADVNQSGGPNPAGGEGGDIAIGDISELIDALFIVNDWTQLSECL